MKTELILGLSFVAMCTGTILRRMHLDDRERRRLCKHQSDSAIPRTCGKKTRRQYQMIEESYFSPFSVRKKFHTRFGRKYHAYIFDECRNGHVVLIKDYLKWFSLLELLWRHVTNPTQFSRNESVFEKAGLISEVVADLPTRIAMHAKLKSGSVAAKLDNPVGIKVPGLKVDRLPPARFVSQNRATRTTTSIPREFFDKFFRR